MKSASSSPARQHAIAVVDLGQGEQPSRIAGFIRRLGIPARFISHRIAAGDANVKGIGSRDLTRAAAHRRHAHDQFPGRHPARLDAGIRTFTLEPSPRWKFPTRPAWNVTRNQVRKDARVPEHYSPPRRPSRAIAAVPVPSHVGERRLRARGLHHQGKRTYDQIFGDIEAANGDPTLCIFGRDVTPNHHALAEQFVLLETIMCMECCRPTGTNGPSKERSPTAVEKSFGGWPAAIRFPATMPSPSSPAASSGTMRCCMPVVSEFRGDGMAAPIPANFDVLKQTTTITRIIRRIKFKLTTASICCAATARRNYPGWNLMIPTRARGSLPQGAQGL